MCGDGACNESDPCDVLPRPGTVVIALSAAYRKLRSHCATATACAVKWTTQLQSDILNLIRLASEKFTTFLKPSHWSRHWLILVWSIGHHPVITTLRVCETQFPMMWWHWYMTLARSDAGSYLTWANKCPPQLSSNTPHSSQWETSGATTRDVSGLVVRANSIDMNSKFFPFYYM